MDNRVSHKEMLIRLRSRMVDAVESGLIPNEGKEVYEQTLITIMNEAERNRINCLKQAEGFRLKAAEANSQASGYEAMIAVVFNILNSFVRKAEIDNKEVTEFEMGDETEEEAKERAAFASSKKKTRKTTVKKKASRK